MITANQQINKSTIFNMCLNKFEIILDKMRAARHCKKSICSISLNPCIKSEGLNVLNLYFPEVRMIRIDQKIMLAWNNSWRDFQWKRWFTLDPIVTNASCERSSCSRQPIFGKITDFNSWYFCSGKLNRHQAKQIIQTFPWPMDNIFQSRKSNGWRCVNHFHI